MDFNIEDYEEEKNFILNNPAIPTLKLMRDFAKEYHKKQLTLTDVACSAEEAIILLKYYEEKCFKKVNGKLVLVRDEHLQKYNNYKNWLDNKELHYR